MQLQFKYSCKQELNSYIKKEKQTTSFSSDLTRFDTNLSFWETDLSRVCRSSRKLSISLRSLTTSGEVLLQKKLQ